MLARNGQRPSIGLRLGLFLALACVWLAPVQAEEPPASREQISALRKQIDGVNRWLNEAESNRSRMERTLRDTEKSVGEVTRKVTELQQRQQETQREIEQLTAQESTLQTSLEQQRRALAAQLRAAWMQGESPALQALLDTDDPQALSRQLTWLGYLAEDGGQRLATFEQTLDDLRQTRENIVSRQAELAHSRATLDREQADLQQRQKERERALAALREDIAGKRNELNRLQGDQARLEKVLRDVERAAAELRKKQEAERVAREEKERREREQKARELAQQRAREEAQRQARDDKARETQQTAKTEKPEKPATQNRKPADDKEADADYTPKVTDSGKPFARMRAKLPWPARGRVLGRFGDSLAQGQLKRNGILIGTARNARVHAVHGGRVVFGNWLRGFGLLLIVDHGNNYMSLYGHNSSLLKEPGDAVKAGEPIAIAGDSGGADAIGLYFEIRHRGSPVNPMHWLAPAGR